MSKARLRAARPGVFLLVTIALVLAACSSAPVTDGKPPAEPSEAEFRTSVDAFIDEWHADAAHARLAYFDKIAPDGVYIGTDRTERWTRDAFKAWSARYFARPSAWTFTAIRRNVAFTPDRTIIWFDEQLRSDMGTLQASGVMRRAARGFEIVHYQLSVAVPNEVNAEVTGVIKAFEAR